MTGRHRIAFSVFASSARHSSGRIVHRAAAFVVCGHPDKIDRYDRLFQRFEDSCHR